MAKKIIRIVYLILVFFVAPVAAAAAWLRGLSDASRRERLRDRFGRPALANRAPVIWVHAASMGEVQAGATLVRRLLEKYSNHEIVMTTMTVTGAARVRALFTERVTHCYLPYDLPFAVRGFLDRSRPRMAIILETELWPNLLRECTRREIPVAIASARISPRTAARYRRFAALFRPVLHRVAIAAQTSEDAQRFKALGAEDVTVGGNLKFDIDIPKSARDAGRLLREQFGDRFVWVAGSTHAGEEAAALLAHRELLKIRGDALLIVVPRHRERFAEVRALLSDLCRESNVQFVTRSSGAIVTATVAVVLVDTMGELFNQYAAADLAFVGGSLVPVGGHNLLEPAALGVPVLCGPHTENAREIFNKLADRHAVVSVASPEQLRDAVCRLAQETEQRRALGTAAQEVISENRGAVERFMALLP